MSQEQNLWLVYSQDEHGGRRLIISGVCEPRADAILAHFAKNKPHKTDYFKHSYAKGTRNAILEAEMIRE